MPTKPPLDQRTERAITTVKMPALLKVQLDQYADQLCIPINSVMILLLDRGLQAAGYPGVSSRLPDGVAPTGFVRLTSD